MITKTPVDQVKDRAGWLKDRERDLGGSEIGAVLGLNPFMSAYSLWCERTGKTQPFEGNLATEVGSYLEEFVARKFVQLSGLKVETTKFSWRNDKYPHLHANPDRLDPGVSRKKPCRYGLEIKTTNSYNADKFRGEDFPAQYYAQAVAYMAIMEAPEWYIAVLVGNNAFHIYHLTRTQGAEKPPFCDSSLYVSEDEIKALSLAADAFWECIVNNTPPDMDGSDATSDALTEVYPESIPDTRIELFGRAGLLTEYLDIQKRIKELEEQAGAIKATICEDLGENESGYVDNFDVSWKTSAGRQTFDAKACVKAHPEMAAYYKTSAGTRRFAVKIK